MGCDGRFGAFSWGQISGPLFIFNLTGSVDFNRGVRS